RDLVSAFVYARDVFFETKTLSAGAKENSLHTKNNDNSADDGNSHTSNENKASQAQAILASSAVLLLLHPEHLTAANERKRALLRLHDLLLPHRSPSPPPPHAASRTHRRPPHDLPVEQDLLLTTSLLTSPLRRHAKSPTLWAHRLWLLTYFRFPHILPPSPSPEASPPRATAPPTVDDLAIDSAIVGEGPRRRRSRRRCLEAARGLFERELDVLLRAGERHFANYYAFAHGRAVLDGVERWLRLQLRLQLQREHPPQPKPESPEAKAKGEGESEDERVEPHPADETQEELYGEEADGMAGNERADDDEDEDDDGDEDDDDEEENKHHRDHSVPACPLLLPHILRRTHAWCLAHPRDISGWSFLLHLLQHRCGAPCACRAAVRKGASMFTRRRTGSGGEDREEVAQAIVRETRAFHERFGWKGEGVRWFLEAVR
ncbi:MAG: hypothetical protein LQ340_008078, partial [Diploschistes diacapsis]